MMRRIAIWLGSLALILVTIGILAGLGMYKYRTIQAAASAPLPPEMPIAVMVAPVEMQSYRQSATMIGTILAPRSITVSNELPGTVAELALTSGEVVEADQVLVRLDTSVEKAQLAAAQARLELAKSTLQRLKSTASAISKLELDEAVAHYSEAIAAEAELAARIGKQTIRAPFRARAGLSDTHLGQYLPAGTSITTLQSLDGFLHVDFMLPQQVADAMNVGDSIRLDTPGDSLQATIIAFDAIADRGSRNLKARARIDDPPVFLQPGDSVRVLADFGPTIQTPVIPAQALRRSPEGALVFVVQPDASGQSRARARVVQAGPTQGNRVRVLAGLNADDRVVADGSFKVRDGALIVDTSSPEAGN